MPWWGGFALIPEFSQQLGARIGGDQFKLRAGFGQIAKQSHSVRVHMADNNPKRLVIVREEIRKRRKKHVAVGRPGGMHQNSGLIVVRFE